MIVTLGLPPLAQAYGNGLGYAVGQRQLDVAQPRRPQAYLARARRGAGRSRSPALRRAIPQARVSWRYQIVLDGFTVTVPAAQLPRLLQLGFAHGLPELALHALARTRARRVIGATQLAAATGASGAGIKIGVVDDGIDQTNPFFNPTGFSYPPGFPKGDTAYTTPKVIVARAFPGPGSGSRGHAPARPEGVVPRHARGRDRRRRREHDRAARPRPPGGHRPVGRRAARVARQLPRLQRPDAARRRRLRRDARRSWPPSRAPSPTAWT